MIYYYCIIFYMFLNRWNLHGKEFILRFINGMEFTFPAVLIMKLMCNGTQLQVRDVHSKTRLNQRIIYRYPSFCITLRNVNYHYKATGSSKLSRFTNLRP